MHCLLPQCWRTQGRICVGVSRRQLRWRCRIPFRFKQQGHPSFNFNCNHHVGINHYMQLKQYMGAPCADSAGRCKGAAAKSSSKHKCKDKRSKLSPECTRTTKRISCPGWKCGIFFINCKRVITVSMRELHATEKKYQCPHNSSVDNDLRLQNNVGTRIKPNSSNAGPMCCDSMQRSSDAKWGQRRIRFRHGLLPTSRVAARVNSTGCQNNTIAAECYRPKPETHAVN